MKTKWIEVTNFYHILFHISSITLHFIVFIMYFKDIWLLFLVCTSYAFILNYIFFKYMLVYDFVCLCVCSSWYAIFNHFPLRFDDVKRRRENLYCVLF